MNTNTTKNPLTGNMTGVSGKIETDFRNIIRNLNREIEKIEHRTNKGLLLAAIDIRRDMEDTPPLIPLKHGNLRSSWFTTTKNGVNAELKALETTKASFRRADTKEILIKLREGHKQTLIEAKGELSKVKVGVMLGFSAFYAAPVHEMIGEDVQWSKSGSGAKFLQASVFRNFDHIIQVVKSNVKIP